METRTTVKKLTRRTLLGVAGGTVMSAAAGNPVGTAGRVAAQETVNIRAAGFVESQEQLKHTLDVLKQYAAKHPGVKITPDFAEYSAYTQKLATEVAGGNAPDMLSTNADLMGEYARRNVLRPLDQYVPKPLGLSDYAQGTVTGNTIDGKLYGIPNDCISTGLIVDTTVFEKTKIAVPDQMWTWDQFAETAAAVHKAMGRDFYGTEDGGRSYINLDMFLRGRGKEFTTKDGELGFAKDDLTAWFAFWDKLRKSGGCPPGDVQGTSSSDDLSRTLFIRGQAAILPQLTDSFVGAQALTKHQLAMHQWPNGFDAASLKQHNYTYAGNSTSISAKTSHADTVIDIIHYMHKDPAGIATFYHGSGLVPPSAAARAVLKREGSPAEQVVVAYIELVLKDAASPRNPAFAGASNLLGRMNENVAFGRLNPSQAADQFISEAKAKM